MRERLGAHQCHVYLGQGFGGKEGFISTFGLQCNSCYFFSFCASRRDAVKDFVLLIVWGSGLGLGLESLWGVYVGSA